MKTIVIQPFGGLCNRMRTIASVVELAEKLHCKIKVLWVKDSALNASFESLFEGFPYEVVETRRGSFFQKFFFFLYTKALKYKYVGENWVSTKARRKEERLWLDELKGQNLYLESCSDIYKDKGVYNIFNYQKALGKHIITNKEGFVGIHIRRSDNEMSIKYSPTSLFIDAIEKEIKQNPVVKIYLATDDLREEASLRDLFGDRIYSYKKQKVDRNTEEGIMDAMIDLANLAHCKKIYGSYYSSFSDVEAMWGNVDKVVLKNND